MRRRHRQQRSLDLTRLKGGIQLQPALATRRKGPCGFLPVHFAYTWYCTGVRSPPFCATSEGCLLFGSTHLSGYEGRTGAGAALCSQWKPAGSLWAGLSLLADRPLCCEQRGLGGCPPYWVRTGRTPHKLRTTSLQSALLLSSPSIFVGSECKQEISALLLPLWPIWPTVIVVPLRLSAQGLLTFPREVGHARQPPELLAHSFRLAQLEVAAARALGRPWAQHVGEPTIVQLSWEEQLEPPTEADLSLALSSFRAICVQCKEIPFQAHCFAPLQSVLGFASSVGSVCVEGFCFAGFARRREEQGTMQCEPMEARIAGHVRVASHLLSHVVHVATSSLCGRPLQACRSCVVHSARQFSKLLLTCLVVGGVPRPFAWRCMCCFEQGRHPFRGMLFSKFVRVKLPKVLGHALVVVPLVELLGWRSGPRKLQDRSFRPPSASACHLATGAAAAATLRHSVALRSLGDPKGVSESD